MMNILYYVVFVWRSVFIPDAERMYIYSYQIESVEHWMGTLWIKNEGSVSSVVKAGLSVEIVELTIKNTGSNEMMKLRKLYIIGINSNCFIQKSENM